MSMPQRNVAPGPLPQKNVAGGAIARTMPLAQAGKRGGAPPILTRVQFGGDDQPAGAVADFADIPNAWLTPQQVDAKYRAFAAEIGPNPLSPENVDAVTEFVASVPHFPASLAETINDAMEIGTASEAAIASYLLIASKSVSGGAFSPDIPPIGVRPRHWDAARRMESMSAEYGGLLAVAESPRLAASLVDEARFASAPALMMARRMAWGAELLQYPQTAKHLRHWLGGSGELLTLDPSWLRSEPSVIAAENANHDSILRSTLAAAL